jgi:hypothetical protein
MQRLLHNTWLLQGNMQTEPEPMHQKRRSIPARGRLCQWT